MFTAVHAGVSSFLFLLERNSWLTAGGTFRKLTLFNTATYRELLNQGEAGGTNALCCLHTLDPGHGTLREKSKGGQLTALLGGR